MLQLAQINNCERFLFIGTSLKITELGFERKETEKKSLIPGIDEKDI